MTDYLNPDKLYPDDPARRIDNPPGFDSVRPPVKGSLTDQSTQLTARFVPFAKQCVACGAEMAEENPSQTCWVCDDIWSR